MDLAIQNPYLKTLSSFFYVLRKDDIKENILKHFQMELFPFTTTLFILLGFGFDDLLAV